MNTSVEERISGICLLIFSSIQPRAAKVVGHQITEAGSEPKWAKAPVTELGIKKEPWGDIAPNLRRRPSGSWSI